MIKKTGQALALSALLLLPSPGARCASLQEAAGQVTRRLGVETNVDTGLLRFYGDWRSVTPAYAPALSGALAAGLLSPAGRLLHPQSEDFSPLLRGISRYAMKSASFYVTRMNPSVVTDENTLYLIGSEILTRHTLKAGVGYCALVTRDASAYLVWEEAAAKPQWLYRGRLYLHRGDQLILTDAGELRLGKYLPLTKEKYTLAPLGASSLQSPDGALTQGEANAAFLDRDVYIIGEYKNGVLRADYALAP